MAENKKPFRWVEDGAGRRHMETDMGHSFYWMEPTGETRDPEVPGMFHAHQSVGGAEQDYEQRIRRREIEYGRALEAGAFMLGFGGELSLGDYDKCRYVGVALPMGRHLAVEKKYFEYVLDHQPPAGRDYLDAASMDIAEAAARGDKAVAKDGGHYSLFLGDPDRNPRCQVLSIPASAIRSLDLSRDDGEVLGPKDTREASMGDPFVYRRDPDDPESRADIAVPPAEMGELFDMAELHAKGVVSGRAAFDTYLGDAPESAFVETYVEDDSEFDTYECPVAEYTPERAEEMARMACRPEAYIVREGGEATRFASLRGVADKLAQSYDGKAQSFGDTHLSVDAGMLAEEEGEEGYADAMRGVYDTLWAVTGKEPGGAGFEAWVKDRMPSGAAKAAQRKPAQYSADGLPDVQDEAREDDKNFV